MHEKDRKETTSRPPETQDAPLAKLSMPRLARGLVRERLHRQLDEARRSSLIWISAPGGAGKTTLAATYITDREIPYLWYQLDRDDADPATFFYYLGIAARRVAIKPDAFLPLLTPEYLPDIPGFARRYFHDLYALMPQGMILVLDNYQELNDAEIFIEILKSAISEVPEDANLMVISRGSPPSELEDAPLEVLDWDALRLTLDEFRLIASQSQSLDEDTIRTLHERSEGWPAGLTLLLEQIKRKGVDDWVFGTGSLETVFNFFASEFFDDLPETTQEFLLKTALLSHMTPELAAGVSGNNDAGIILSDLHYRHFFTNRRDVGNISYQYHALFREFLLAKSMEAYTHEQLLDLVHLVGRLLVENMRCEEAIYLYLQAGDWEAAIPLLLSQAPQLFAQGRSQIVAGWLQCLPDKLVNSVPWLLYWKGASQMSIQPFEALDTIQRANSGFSLENDAIGKMLSASTILDITYFLRQSLLSIIPWLESLQSELSLNPSFPSTAVEGRILTTLLSVLTYMQPEDAQLSSYASRLEVILDNDIDVNQKILIGTHLVHYYCLVSGDMQACERIVMRVQPLLKLSELTMLNQILWRTLFVVFPVIACREEDAIQSVYPISSMVTDNNLYFVEFFAELSVTVVQLNFDIGFDYKGRLHRLEILVNTSQPADVAWLYLLKTMYALALGDYKMALSYGETSLELTSGVGAALVEIDVRCLLIIACCGLGRSEEAYKHLEWFNTLDLTKSPRIRRDIAQVEAFLYLNQGEISKSHILIREAFSIASTHGYFGSWLCWNRRVISCLCAEALRAGIEVDYVRQLIKRRKLMPEAPTVENWPWPVRVYTLGEFKLAVDEQAVAETGLQSKPISLLKVLIALGGSEVKIERISEILWPEAEGDAAVSTFTTTVSRLRRMIGEEAIIVRGGRVSLDEFRCWVDLRALERALDEDDGSMDEFAVCGLLEKCSALYQGPFLIEEEGGWVQHTRYRIRSKLSRLLARYAQSLDGGSEEQRFTAQLRRLYEADPDLEKFDGSSMQFDPI